MDSALSSVCTRTGESEVWGSSFVRWRERGLNCRVSGDISIFGNEGCDWDVRGRRNESSACRNQRRDECESVLVEEADSETEEALRGDMPSARGDSDVLLGGEFR